ncbi:uncharacterized protein LOC126907941 isoform X1 [Daktulosphaira vitifoliae]|uniref:uncharacterized protein LOC126907941 isoform X1 n=1 Tax=Daktulosphaira vitifoliae TaxID=58002 RepID=UPI0021AA650C|nr:uncharacterized protein LOC126907941 isoform X1 [Daktulosphaira vitifoliae]
MNFFSFILIFIVVFVLQPDKRVHCETYHAMYENYIERVVSHIYLKIISYRKQDSNNDMDIDKAFQPNSKMLNFRQKYCYIIDIINFKYLQILRKFLSVIRLVLNKCQQFYQKNVLNIFIPYVRTLEAVVKNSKTMIENLHNAMMFLSYIDTRFLFSEGFIPHPIIDAINFIHPFVLEISLETNSFDLNKSPYEISEMKLENLTVFQTDASEKVEFFFQNCNSMDIFLTKDLKNIKIAELPNDLLSARKEIMNKFFDEIIEVWYINIGFEEFLNPKTAEFTPPIDPDTNQNDGIEALNIIRKESGWEKMNHISIIYFGKKFSVDQIINDEVSMINFRIKREHVSQLLRCRFTEIMKNYRTLLSAMLYVCDKYAYNYYHNCLSKLFSSFVKSKKMLEDLYEALVTLNKSSIWSVNYNSKSSLHKVFEWVAEFLSLLKKNDFSLKNIDDNKIEILQQLLIIFKNNFISFNSQLSNEISHYDKRCHIDEKFKNVQYYVNHFRNPGNISINLNLEFLIQIMLNACNFFDSFCENTSKSCYEDLGFEKISHCKNKKLDSRLL